MWRNALSLTILAMLALLCVAGSAAAAGMSTHCEVSTRAAVYFDHPDFPEYREIINAHPEAYQAGSPFPDWGYAFGYHDASEDAHWSPFLTEFAEYIRDTYPKPWDEGTDKLMAFFAGVISHANADLDWHSLGGVQDGTITAMSELEMDGDWNEAHGVADTGGEFVEIYQRDMDWLKFNWYFPYADIVAVYERFGYEPGVITEAVLRPRTFMLFLGALGNRLGGMLFYEDYATQSPFLVEQFNDYFIGGLDGMAIRVMWEWQDYIDIIEGDPAQLDARLIHTGGDQPHANLSARDFALGIFLWETGLVDVTVESTPRGDTFSAAVPRALLKTFDPPAAPSRTAAPSAAFTSTTDYHYLGQDIATGDFDGDGKTDLVLGAPGLGEPGTPQHGSVYVFLGRDTWDAQYDVADASLTLLGENAHDRFGWQVETVDWNADGIDDLAVGAPTTDAPDQSYYGKVSVFFGGENFGGPADVEIEDRNTHSNFGHRLAAGDLNDDGFADLIVASPFARHGGRQAGLVAVYFADRDAGTYNLDDADWWETGESSWDWFGYAVTVAQSSGGAQLIVGAPYVQVDEAAGAGAVYGFDFTQGPPDEPLFVLRGANKFDKLGSALAVGNFFGGSADVLAVSAPTRTFGDLTHTGAVVLLGIDGLRGELDIDGPLATRTLEGDQDWSRLGWRLVAGDLNDDGADDLLVSEPWRKTAAGRMAGAVRWYPGGPGLRGANLVPLGETFEGASAQGMFGWELAIADLNDDGRDDLLVGAKADLSHARHGGSAQVFLTSPEDFE
jgi:glycosylphosphatidylinositol phospholipase D